MSNDSYCLHWAPTVLIISLRRSPPARAINSIIYDEATGVLRTPTPPSQMPRPDFPKVRALRKHFHLAPSKLQCPQSLIYGWTGMAMDPVMYLTIKTNAFITPIDPGPTPQYNLGFQATQQIKLTEQIWKNACTSTFITRVFVYSASWCVPSIKYRTTSTSRGEIQR